MLKEAEMKHLQNLSEHLHSRSKKPAQQLGGEPARWFLQEDVFITTSLLLRYKM